MNASPHRAVFLDRDGTINAMVYNAEFGLVDSPANPAELALLPGAADAIRTLNEMGFLVVVASNQPGVAKGKLTPALLEATTARLHAELARAGARLDAVYYCLHHPEARLDDYRLDCDCRKPQPGLLRRAAQEMDVDLRRSYFVGDGLTDVQAGQAAGTATILLQSRRCYACDELARQNVQPDFFARDLREAVEIIRLREGQGTRNREQGIRNKGEGQGEGDEPTTTHTVRYLAEAITILQQIDQAAIERLVSLLCALKQRGGRLFFLGVGGGAGHASHAVNDFRKIAGIESYAPTDNVSELTARINDDGWESAYVEWLRGSRLRPADMVFVFSVGGGDAARQVSVNLVRALQYARTVGATIGGVVGPNGGFTRQVADACVVVPVANPATVTPHTEGFQALIWHLLVCHPALQAAAMKWESIG